MPNTIVQQQASERFVDLIAASTEVYWHCSLISTGQAVLSVVAAVLGPILAWINPDLRAWAALFAIAALVIDRVFLDPWYKRKKLLGTNIQELFDTDLFGLPWNKVKCGDKPPEADIAPLIRAYKKVDPRCVNIDRRWYPHQIEGVTFDEARLICQKSTLRWDGGIRKTYAQILVAVFLLYVFAGAAYGLWAKLSMADYLLSFLIPTLPMARQIAESSLSHFEWAGKAENQQAYIDGLWERLQNATQTNSTEILTESRQLQDEIYERRKSTARLPEILYKVLRLKYQDHMESNAESDVARSAAKGQ